MITISADHGMIKLVSYIAGVSEKTALTHQLSTPALMASLVHGTEARGRQRLRNHGKRFILNRLTWFRFRIGAELPSLAACEADIAVVTFGIVE